MAIKGGVPLRMLSATQLVCVATLSLSTIAAPAVADTVTMKDGNILDGKISLETDSKIVLIQKSGTTFLRKSDIADIKKSGPSGPEQNPVSSAPLTPPLVRTEHIDSFAAPSGYADPLFPLVVKVTTTIAEPDYFKPWSRREAKTFNFSGVVYGGGMILTSAYAVVHATDIQIQLGPLGVKRQATVDAVDRDLNLGLVKISGSDLNEVTEYHYKAKDQSPRTNDPVKIYGFPENETNVVTNGALIDHMDYGPPDSYCEGLRLYLTRGFKPGVIGGPVFDYGGLLVGISSITPLGTPYVTPISEVNEFMDRAWASVGGPIKLRPKISQHFQHLENAALRSFLGMPASIHGMLVAHAEATRDGSPFRDLDIVTGIGDASIDDVGEVLLVTGMKFSYGYAVEDSQNDLRSIGVGSGSSRKTYGYYTEKSQAGRDRAVPFHVIRGGQKVDITVPIASSGNSLLDDLGRNYPPYFIAGPVVFSTASQQLMAEVDQSPQLSSKLSFRGSPLVKRRADAKSFDGEQLVIISSPLFPGRGFEGYEDPSLLVVKSVNGISIKNLLHLVKVIRDSTDELIDIEFADTYAERLVFPRTLLLRSTEAILEDNDVRSQGSDDVMAVWNRVRPPASNATMR